MAPRQLWNRNFVLWWLGSAQSAFGSALAGVALSFLVLRQTGSAGAMGVTLALALLPALCSPLLGPLIDRWPVRLPLIAGNVLRGVLQLGVGLWALSGTVPLTVIYAASLLGGLVGAFYTPASMGVTVRLVPRTELVRASGLMQGAGQTMNMLGLVGGGLLVGLIGKGEALMLDGLTFLVFAALLGLVRFPVKAARSQANGNGAGKFWAELRGGLDYVRGSLLLTSLPLVSLVLNASFAPIEMLIPKRMQALEAGAAGYGFFFGALVGGLALGGFVVAALGPRLNPERAALGGVATMGGLVLGLALTRSALPMYGLAALIGLANAFCNTGLGVMFQQRVAPEYFGRVGSLLMALGQLGVPVTLLALAPLADHLPIAVIFAVTGSLCLAGAGAWAWVMTREPQPSAAAPLAPDPVQATI